MSDAKKSHTASRIGWAVVVALVIYAGFPVLWIWPLFALCASDLPSWCEVLFVPIGWLADHVPAYESWMDWQVSLLFPS
ncbi:MAG: hypothetical protein KDK99_15205 [Verrucomicrobiales bacterium]|nr:hypothetical protein [Verrucomicrobiales bacterium]